MMVQKRIALISHDECKSDMVEWCRQNQEKLARHALWATGNTGALVAAETDLTVRTLLSGPLGGDLQIGAKIVEGDLDILIFFWDPLMSQPHDPDVKALLRVAVLKNIPVATNSATADYIINSPMLGAK